MPSASSDVMEHLGRKVVSTSDETLGRVSDVLAEAETRTPRWLVIQLRRPLWGHRAVPLSLAVEKRQRIYLPLSSATLRGSPPVRIRSSLTAAEERSLTAYWADVTQY